MPKKALVVVLGELARSPRMRYHCMSLARNNYEVTVIATGNNKGCEDLDSYQNVNQLLMNDPPDLRKHLPSILSYLIKPIWQSFLLICCLLKAVFYHSIPHVIIVQNPPSIPTLPILCIFSKLLCSKLIIDWHNYGYSILTLTLGPHHKLVGVSKWIETQFGRLADAGFCVSEAMRADLVDNFKITYPLYVLYDRPPEYFKPLNLREKHNFYTRMTKQYTEFQVDKSNNSGELTSGVPSKLNGTRFTKIDSINKDLIVPRPNRPAIIMSSTSWTEDEDFGVLLDALKLYNEAKSEQMEIINMKLYGGQLNGTSESLPDLVCIITGKGPMKPFYEKKLRELKLEHVEVILPWLSTSDYTKMVASSDLGVCLHRSSSGVDLPMKVVDMFGCGIPVLAYNYKAISELVKEDKYGLTFQDAQDLSTKLITLLKDFYIEDICSRDEVECSPLGRYKKNIKRFLSLRWEDNWNRVAKPVFDKLRHAFTQ